MKKASVVHLLGDHAQVSTVLGAFRHFLAVVSDQESPPRTDVWGLLDSLSDGLFLRHEEKEELILLPELARHGLSWSDGRLAHVRREHRHGRNLFRNLHQSSHQREGWSPEERRHFVRVGTDWADFLARHMEQEETALFPLIESQLSDAEDAALIEQFQALDREFAEMNDAEALESSCQRFLLQYAPVDSG